MNLENRETKIAEFKLQFEIANYFKINSILRPIEIKSVEQKISGMGAKCLLEVTPSYFIDFNLVIFTKCCVTITDLCEVFQLSGMYQVRIICTVGGVNVFDQKTAITSSSVKAGNDDMDTRILKSKVLANGSLIFDVKVELYCTGLTRTVVLNHIKKYKALAENIAKMLQCSKFSDFTFIVKGKEFKVHRNILAQASPVFAALFETDLEKAQRKCVIKDIEPSIFGHLLYYIYKLELPQDLGSASKDLYEAAHYYEVTELKNICLLHVSSTLTVKNAIELFYWFVKYDEDLSVKAWEIIKFMIIKREILKIFLPLEQEPPSVLLLDKMLEINKMHSNFWELQTKKSAVKQIKRLK